MEEEVEEEDIRVIYQLHYNSWSSHTTPFPNSILQFRRRVRIYMDEVIKEEGDRVGPTIVHCRFVSAKKFFFIANFYLLFVVSVMAVVALGLTCASMPILNWLKRMACTMCSATPSDLNIQEED